MEVMDKYVVHWEQDGPTRPIPQLLVQLSMHLFVLHMVAIHVMDMFIGFQLRIAMDIMYMVYIHLEHVLIGIVHNN
jgi:hypothetical protein